jgi:hypothetical protein
VTGRPRHRFTMSFLAPDSYLRITSATGSSPSLVFGYDQGRGWHGPGIKYIGSGGVTLAHRREFLRNSLGIAPCSEMVRVLEAGRPTDLVFKGKPHIGIEFRDGGDPLGTLIVERGSSRVVGLRYEQVSIAGQRFEVEWEFGDHRIVGGVLLPHVIMRGPANRMEVERYVINPPLTPEDFRDTILRLEMR